MSSNTKKQTFDDIVHWMENHRVVFENKKPISREVQYEATVFPQGKKSEKLFYIGIFEQYDDIVAFYTAVKFPENIQKSISGLTFKDRQSLYMDIRKVVYPFHVQVQAKKEVIKLSRPLHFDTIKNKQLFMDAFYDFGHVIDLVTMRIDEVHHTFFPRGNKGNIKP